MKQKPRNREIWLRNLQFIYDYYSVHPCVDCGESDPIVLEFDHVRDSKIKAVSILVKGRYSLEAIQNEIDKCEVRCANCHKRKTAREQSWYGSIITLPRDHGRISTCLTLK